jgi:transposase InsO family protein
MEPPNDQDAVPEKQLRRLLKRIYYSPSDPGGYGGVKPLLASASRQCPPHLLPLLSQQFVEQWLQGQQAYTLHRPARKHFPRRKIVAGGIDAQWQADLADMHGRAAANDGYKWILVVVDTFSKYAWAVPVKSKSAVDMLDAFRKLFRKAAPRKPVKLQTDKGKEFIARSLQEYLESLGITRFSSESDQKAAGAERFNRTLKTKIETYVSAHQDERWIDRLDQYLEAYNQKVHRTIGMAPAAVQQEHEPELWRRMYGEAMNGPSSPRRRRHHQQQPVTTGAKVRISNVKGDFAKGYHPNWSQEHFLVRAKRRMPGGKVQYFLKEDDYGDIKGEELTGAFNREEVEPITKNRYLIEKVLRTRTLPAGRGHARHKQYFVKWVGWPEKYNSWVTEDQVTAIKGHGEKL